MPARRKTTRTIKNPITPKKASPLNQPDYKNYKSPDHYGDWLGYKVESADFKRFEAKLSLVVRREHLSSAGRVHGGVVAGFLDFACGAAVFTTLAANDFCSTVDLKVSYFKPLFEGDVLECQSRVIFRGKRLCSVIADVYRINTTQSDSKLVSRTQPVAHASATFNIVSPNVS